MGCNFICLCKHSNSLCGINNRLFNYYNWRNCYNYSFLFFIAFYVLINRGHRFRKINNAIVREYNENKNGELFLEKLFAIEEKATDMNDEITWYLNIATAFSVLGKKNESISLLKQLEEVTTGGDKELIQKSIEFIQGQMENEC